MHSIRIIALPALAAALVSCASQNGYDTANPYGTPDGGATTVNAPYQPTAPAAPANPVYDTPAAYEDATGAPPPADPAAINPAAPATNPGHAAPAAAATTTAGNRIHVVEKGDVLSKIAQKYKVPAASIKAANNMKNDTVVLGKKLIIPPK